MKVAQYGTKGDIRHKGKSTEEENEEEGKVEDGGSGTLESAGKETAGGGVFMCVCVFVCVCACVCVGMGVCVGVGVCVGACIVSIVLWRTLLIATQRERRCVRE